jgi:hypothetical protein
MDMLEVWNGLNVKSIECIITLSNGWSRAFMGESKAQATSKRFRTHATSIVFNIISKNQYQISKCYEEGTWFTVAFYLVSSMNIHHQEHALSYLFSQRLPRCLSTPFCPCKIERGKRWKYEINCTLVTILICRYI